MNIFVAILGLAFLILIHEAGHFFVALAVGMRPRKFYLGFPPAAVKTKRGGIEYGVGVIPLGGYVKIPGMHRLAPADVDMHFAPRARGAARARRRRSQRLKRAVEAGNEAAADADRRGDAGDRRRQAAGRLRARRPGGPRRALAAGVLAPVDLEPHRGDPRRARRRTSSSPSMLFTVLFMAGGGKATTPSTRCCRASRRRAIGPAGPATGSSPINGVVVGPTDISTAISGSKGKPVTLTVLRGAQRRHARPGPPDADRRRVPARLRPARREARRRRVGVAVAEADRDRHARDRQVARPASSTARAAKDISSPSGSRRGSRRARSRAPGLPLGARADQPLARADEHAAAAAARRRAHRVLDDRGRSAGRRSRARSTSGSPRSGSRSCCSCS